MKNSCRSDRELAKAIGTSQPTVSRLKRRLLEEGYLQEFTVIPNFQKLGYHLLALTFFTWNKAVDESRYEEARKSAMEKAPHVASNVILIERGIGLKYDSFMISLHKDYTSYTELLDEVKKNPYLNAEALGTFIVNLDDKIHYRALTFSTLAKHLLTMKEDTKNRT